MKDVDALTKDVISLERQQMLKASKRDYACWIQI